MHLVCWKSKFKKGKVKKGKFKIGKFEKGKFEKGKFKKESNFAATVKWQLFKILS